MFIVKLWISNIKNSYCFTDRLYFRQVNSNLNKSIMSDFFLKTCSNNCAVKYLSFV